MEIKEILGLVERNENSAFLFASSYYPGEKCLLCLNPDRIYKVYNQKDYDSVFEEIEACKREFTIISLMNYEAGYLFEKGFERFINGNASVPLMKFLFYKNEECRVWDSGEIKFASESGKDEYAVENFYLNTDYDEYANAIEKIKEYIRRGDTYQVNYTIKSKFDFTGDAKSLFITLLNSQSTRYSAFINTGEKLIISISPELFFKKNGSTIITRPMKGTMRRGTNYADDENMKNLLTTSEKERAENVMIADLLRNDFGRISKFGTVKAQSLFDVEKYESVFQMVSEIRGELKEDSLKAIFSNIYPCGSITGAPKIRTMEIIKELEKEERGIYTGSIGYIKGEEALFNVAIRTLVIDKETGKTEMGLGGGIVWDSTPESEYNEVILKGKFLSDRKSEFSLIETLLFENGNYFLLEEHLKRLEQSAGYFLYNFDSVLVKEKLVQYAEGLNNKDNYRIRLLLGKQGNMTIESAVIEPVGKKKVNLILSGFRTDSSDRFYYFKTTVRELYDTCYKSARNSGFFDTIFQNEKGELTEGAITNIFLLKDGIWVTPQISSGLLNGCYREYFIKKVNAVEKKLFLKDLLKAERIVLVNSVRREVEAATIRDKNDIIWRLKG